jgi:hypothetical protein
MPSTDPEQAIERDVEDLERDLGKLDDRLGEAKEKAADRAKEASGEEDGVGEAAGDWEDEAPDEPVGDDPSGAGDETTDSED